jgi:hypothetical protein
VSRRLWSIVKDVWKMNGRRGGFQERFRTRGLDLRCRMPLIDEKAFVKVSPF